MPVPSTCLCTPRSASRRRGLPRPSRVRRVPRLRSRRTIEVPCRPIGCSDRPASRCLHDRAELDRRVRGILAACTLDLLDGDRYRATGRTVASRTLRCVFSSASMKRCIVRSSTSRDDAAPSWRSLRGVGMYHYPRARETCSCREFCAREGPRPRRRGSFRRGPFRGAGRRNSAARRRSERPSEPRDLVRAWRAAGWAA